MAIDEHSATAVASRDQEDIRLVTGFADSFAAVVLAGLMITLIGSASAFLGWGAGLIGMIAAWFLPIPLVERRQFAACAIVLAVSFASSVASIAVALLGVFGVPVVALAMWFYWQRHKIPLSAALGISAIVAFPALLVLLYADGPSRLMREPQLMLGLPGWVSLVVGLMLFFIAMRWDLSDRERVTRRSDVAFWLHVTAGPLLVHGVFGMFGATRWFMVTSVNPLPIIGLFVVFTLTALVIDRRPLLLASFSYFLFALGNLAYAGARTGNLVDATNLPRAMMIAALGGGLVVAVLAAGWSNIRRHALFFLPDAVTAIVPPAAHRTQLAALHLAPARGETEPLRLVLGLNDYLATVAMGVLFIGSCAAAYLVLANTGQSGDKAMTGAAPWLALIIPAAVVCAAAEIFVRRQRMALAAIAASTQFGVISVAGALLLLWQVEGASHFAKTLGVARGGETSAPGFSIAVAWAAAAFANWGFGYRNRIPASAGWGALMILPLFFLDRLVMVLADSRDMSVLFADDAALRLIIFGAMTFGAAMLFDRSDVDRKTQRADIAFWLHLLASLCMVAVLFDWAGDFEAPGLARALVFLALVGIALIINRRAPVVVGIPFVLVTIEVPDPALALTLKLVFFVLLMALVLLWDRIRPRLVLQEPQLS